MEIRKYRLIVAVVLSIVLSLPAFAEECGSNPNNKNGCTVSENTTFTPGTYPLSLGIKINAKNIELDCNGATLQGSGSGTGIAVDDIDKTDNNMIKNCNIKNYLNGVLIGDNVLGDVIANIQLENNNFTSNTRGIFFDRATDGAKITKNTFHDNTIAIFQRNDLDNRIENTNHQIWDNDFFDSGIQYQITQNISFCQANTPNTFHGFAGPTCDCITPVNNSGITEDRKLCTGTYDLKELSFEAKNTNLDCQSAILRGSSTDKGVVVDEFSRTGNNTIQNCNFQNYKYGIFLGDNVQGVSIRDIFIRNNNFTGNENGIILSQSIGDVRVTQNNFANNSVAIVQKNDFDEGNLGIFNENLQVWDNTFTDSFATYQITQNISFCRNGVTNTFTNIDGPECGCIFALDNLGISEDQTLCTRTYDVSGITFEAKNIELDCNGATLQGSGTGKGISIDEYTRTDNNTIKKCNIKNYQYGVFIGDNVLGDDLEFNTITQNTIYNNTNGIFFSQATGQNTISFNTINDNAVGVFFNNNNVDPSTLIQNDIYSNSLFALRNDLTSAISAENNWWGSGATADINAVIFDCNDNGAKGCVDFDPFKTEGPESRFFDINISSASFSGTSLLNTTITNSGADLVNNVVVKALHLSNGNLQQEANTTVSLAASGSQSVIFNLTLAKGDSVVLIVDPDNTFRESNKQNNRQQVTFSGATKFYVEADVPPGIVNDTILSFITSNLQDGTVVASKDDADIIILIARHNPLIVWHFATIDERGWGFVGGGMKHNEDFCDKPYCGVIGNIEVNGRKEIYLEANDIEGFIAVAKRFIDEQSRFTTQLASTFIGETDVTALAVFDYLHNDDNEQHYKKNSTAFQSIVKSALEENMQTEVYVNATVDGLNLRLLNLKPAFSENFLAFKDTVNLPVVLGAGLWNDLTYWKEFGQELASEHSRDTWLIEITGGPDTDCTNKETDDCPDYTYDDITTKYVPALFNKVLTETGKTKIQYVGFSNGCRSALTSLENNDFAPSKVDTFVGVGCPGAFSRISYFASLMKEKGSTSIENMESKGFRHITVARATHEIGTLVGESIAFTSLFGEQQKISLNLFRNYFEFINSTSDQHPGRNMELDYFTLIYGNDGLGLNKLDDFIVPVADEQQIFQEIDAQNKYLVEVFVNHGFFRKSRKVKDTIKSALKKEVIS
ncbi:MAG: hypothetical protein O2779_04580 [Nanoarchaeota archaeon]|nr:hypothetical protein [Nanoarchaeota archaeon]